MPALQQEVVGHEMLLDILLRELLVCANMDTPKPYLVALCRCAAALEVFPVGEAEGGVSAADAGWHTMLAGAPGVPASRACRLPCQ